jgi:hypothetical protein
MKRLSFFLFVVSILQMNLLSAIAQLRLYAPNGGEVLTAGSSFQIRWGGVNVSDTVSLDYTTDGGLSWQIIKSSVTGVSYLWNPIPSVSSTNCLVRVSKGSSQSSGILHLNPSGNVAGGYVQFSPDNSRALTSNGNEVHLYNSITGKELWKAQVYFNAVPNFTTTGIAHFALNGTRVIVWVINELSGDTLHVLDAATGAEISHWSAGISKNWRYPNDFFNHVFYADVSPDGTEVAVSQFDTIHIFDIATEQLRNKFGTAASGSTIPYISWTPDGKALAAANASNANSSVRLIDATTGAIIANFTGNAYVISRVRFSNDGKTMAVVSIRGDSSAIDFWDVASVTHKGRLTSSRYFQDVDFSPDDSRFVTTDARTAPSVAQWWDTQTLAKSNVLGTRDFLGSIDVSKDGKRVMAGATTGAVIFEPPTTIAGEADTSDKAFSIRLPIADTSLIVQLDSITANTNERISFKVRLQAGKSVDFTGVSGLQGDISFNTTLLEPIDATPKGNITQNTQTIVWKIPSQLLRSPVDTIVSVFPFLTGLGNDSVTSLTWSNVQSIGIPKIIEFHNGYLRLADICREGTPRLIHTSPKTFLSARPIDKSENSFVVFFRTNEYGTTNIELYNSLGIKVISLVNEQLDLGEHERKLSMDNLSGGVYFLSMTTPTERFVVQVRAIR